MSDTSAERRCCILGGCGCPPGSAKQKDALAFEIVERVGLKKDVALQVAEAALEIFGAGPHIDRMKELGVAEDDINRKV